MSKPEPWRRTGRKAKEEHWFGLERGSILEISLYDDTGKNQGRGVVQLESRTIEDAAEEGQTWRGRLLAIEDEYYAWWVGKTYAYELLPFHFCGRQTHRCNVATYFSKPIHVDVFRVLPEDTCMDLKWLTDAHRDNITQKLESKEASSIPGTGGPGKSGVANPGDGQVKPGREGIDGLAAALGGPAREEDEAGREELREKEKKEKKKRKAEDEEAKEPASGSRGEGLREVLSKRKAAQPATSALALQSGDKKKKKKKDDKGKKKKKSKKEKDKGKQDEDSSSEDEEDSDSSSSTGSLFRLAALPQEVARIHRLHEKRPGALANVTLKRCQELLERAVGRGTAEIPQELPPVARAYLSQIYLPKHTEAGLGLRNLRELRTLTTLVDLIALNDPLRALDVAVQRMKSIELFVSQGQWSQATLLELVLPEDEQRAWFRQELKAVQQEYKSDQKLAQDQWPRRRPNWHSGGPPQGAPKKEGEKSDDQPPDNTGGGTKGKKGKGKGKRGKRW